MKTKPKNDMEKCKHKRIVLFPDFASSGIWCDECGLGFGNPAKTFKDIPNYLIELIDCWNSMWEMMCAKILYHPNTDVSEEQKIINSMGKELSVLVNKYYPCVFDPKRTSLFYLVEKE